MVSGGSGVLQRIREACRWPVPRSTSARDGKGAVIFACTDEVLPLVYRPNLSVRDVCAEAAIKVNISPVALDFFTLVTEDGSLYLNPDKMLCDAECNQIYKFTLCIKACHGTELREFDKQAFEYYFHQCRRDFLRGKIGEFANQTELAKVVLYEIIFRARQKNVLPKVVIDHPVRYDIKSLFQAGVFKNYPYHNEIKPFLKDKIQAYEKLNDHQIKVQYITSLEKADDFFVHKLSFEKIYIIENVSSQRKFEVLVSAEFGIKKRRTDSQKSLPEDIVKNFSEVVALEFDQMNNKVTIIRKNCGPEILRANSPQAANSLVTLIQGYYRLMVNQYKQLLRGQGTRRDPELLCHGPITRDKAANILKHGSKKDGSFLIRKSRKDHFSHALSLYSGNEVNHYIIIQDATGRPTTFCLESDQTKGFSSLLGLIEHYTQSKHGLPVCLSKICHPETEGLSALLDREVMTPPPPDFELVDSSLRISSEDLQLEDPMAENTFHGEFGEVRKGLWCSNVEGDLWRNVVSRAMVKPIARGEKVQKFRKAMDTFLELKNQHLIQFYGITETPKALVFVFEFAAMGPLDDYIKEQSAKDHGITKERVISYAAQIAEGMMFLHEKKCVHGRLSAHNVLVASEEFVKISDHGLLHLVNSGQSFFPTSKRGYGNSYCWFAPLSLQNHTFDEKSDIWSFGVTLWEMLTLKKPFHSSLIAGQVLTEKQVMSRYLTQKYLNLDRRNIPAKVRELMGGCWAPEPEKRFTFRELVLNLRSAELVPQKEAEEFLLLPDITELEDWEQPIPIPPSELELLKHRTYSQVSDVDYSCLRGDEAQSSSSDYANTLPGITYIPSTSLFNNTMLRKQSLSKTFSHPGLTQRPFEADVSEEPLNSLAPRKQSVSRASSCPPVLQTTNVTPQENLEQRTESNEQQKEVACAPSPASVRENNQARNEDVKLHGVPFLTKLETEFLGACAETTVDTSSEDSDGADGGSNRSDSGAGQNTEVCAEALAMRALGGIVKGSGTPSSNPFVDVGDYDKQRGDDEKEKHVSESSSPAVTLLDGTIALAEVVTVGGFHWDEESNFEESGETSPEKGSSNYVSFTRPAPASSNVETTRPAQYKNLRAGSYVELSTATQYTQPQDGNISQTSSAVTSAIHDSASQAASPQSSGSKVWLTSSGYSRPGLNNVEKRTPEGKAVVSSRHFKESPYQMHSQMKEDSPLEDVEFAFKSPDELLASFSNISQPTGGEVVDLKKLLVDVEEDSPTGGSSPLITDLQEDSEGNDTDSSSREDAESSLGRMFHTALNRRDENERGSTLDPTIDALASLADFGQLDVSSEEPTPVQEDNKDSHDNTQMPTRINLENNALFMGFIRSESVDTHEVEPGSPLSEESQNIFSTTSFDQDQFLSNIAPPTFHPTALAFGNFPFEQENNADAREENEPEVDEDDDDTSDNELGMSCGSMGYSPGKVHFLNSPILLFDQGQENFEMKEFSLNNLSKESKKTTELLFFKDNKSASQGISSNQLDETFSDDGFTADDEQGTDGAVEGNVMENSASNSRKAVVDGYLKESTSKPEHSGGNGYTRKEAQPVTDGNAVPRYRPTPEAVEQEPNTVASSSSSSEGVWPDATGEIVRRKSTTASSSSWGEQPAIQFDMDKIPLNLQIPYQQLHLEHKLGEGQFGEVRKASWVYTDSRNFPKREEVAVKVLKTTASQKDSSDFVNEVKNMVELESKQRCKFIIKLRGVSKDPQEKLMLVTELAPYGALGPYLRENKDILGTPQLLTFCMQICKGMEYLERESLLHRDLAARNILVMREDLVKISDFGLSRLQEYYRLEGDEKRFLPVKWYALESLLKGSFTSKSDVWSFGITMWEIFTYGDRPYGNITTSELAKFLEEGKRLDRPSKCPEDVYGVMQSCWYRDPMKRPSFYFLRENDLKKCM